MKVGTEKKVPALAIESKGIDKDCVGDYWLVQDEEYLAELVALIAMGQATQASYVIRELLPAAPAIKFDQLIYEAKVRLTIGTISKGVRVGYPKAQRNGFVFESISWIAARQSNGLDALMLAPHVSATSQGLDGLMIEITADRSKVKRTTIFEDKCTGKPRKTFRDKVIPAFRDRHLNKRSAELVSGAATLLTSAGIDEASAAKLAGAVMDRSSRRYKASFALEADFDNLAKQKKLFKGYSKLDDLKKDQRIGGCLFLDDDLEDWFEHLSKLARAYLDSMMGDE